MENEHRHAGEDGLNNEVDCYRLNRSFSQNSIHGDIAAVLLEPNNFNLFVIFSMLVSNTFKPLRISGPAMLCERRISIFFASVLNSHGNIPLCLASARDTVEGFICEWTDKISPILLRTETLILTHL